MIQFYTRPAARTAANSSDYFLGQQSRKALSTVSWFLGHPIYAVYSRPILVAPDGSNPSSYRSCPPGTHLQYTQLRFGHRIGDLLP